MKINQFANQLIPGCQPLTELAHLRLLATDELETCQPKELWQRLLWRVDCNGTTDAQHELRLHDYLATPSMALDEWLANDQPITDEIFARVALQLLDFEPALDFSLADPLTDAQGMNLQLPTYELWNQAAVARGFYQLLLTRTKHGQTWLDYLTGQGLLTWTYQLPAKQKPLLVNGQPIACFDPHQFIYEVVYVEMDHDTDFDGQADLIKVEIMRPADSNHGLKVPAVFTASPYNQGTNDRWGEIITHDVNQPLTHLAPDHQAPQETKFTNPQRCQAVTGHAQVATETFSNTPGYTLNNYLAPRGYAIVYAAGIGTKDSDGLQTCGSPEQTESMKVVVEWLHGIRHAYTDRTSGITIKASWCNGNVAMTGRSYLGTLSTAVATTGVPGLKAIISEAAISSWYDYYRENGLVMAPMGFQGEDADVLAAETFSRTKRPADYQRITAINQKYLAQMTKAQDRASGQYNDFWRQRDYLPHVKQIKCDVMMVHGLNDWNVKPSNVKHLYDRLQSLSGDHKLILHQGEHIYINAFPSLDFSEIVNLWLAQKLWEVDNHADQLLPNLIVQDNVKAQTWTAYDHWNAPAHQVDLGEEIIQFSDRQPEAQYQQWCKDPGQWAKALLGQTNRFSYSIPLTALQSDYYQGTPHLSLTVQSSLDHGMISAYLVDRGAERRLTISPTMIERQGIQLGYHWQTDDLRDFKLQAQPSDYKMISFGHANLQNPHDPEFAIDLAAQQWVTVEFDLQPIFHHLANHHHLELVIFGTDYQMSLRGNENITYQVDLSKSSLTLPF